MLGDGGGTRALIEVLLLHRHLPAVAVQAGLAAALTVGLCNPDVVAVEARQATGEVAAAAPETDLLAEDHPVISLTEQRLTTHRDSRLTLVACPACSTTTTCCRAAGGPRDRAAPRPVRAGH